ncbi:MAG TPA: DUF2461 domain-containing protein [Bryobacteraceae bacterium]|jgi:uncharacterized protein (TIGR02453 family)|nr:DUF2461 domain-containing protein [Bryobacteraceae bacterium]
MKITFPGFPKEGMAFLRALKKNNDREWFTPRKPVFEASVKAPMIELVSAIHREMLRFAPHYVGEPAKCVYRIYRDTRFSKDKTPYKTFASALLLRNGFDKYTGGAAYYFAVAPDNIEVAGGIYMPDRDVLLAVRRHIADNHKQFRATYSSPKVKKLLGDLQGESVSRAPKGFDPEHPAADLVRRKHYLLDTQLDPKLATTPKLLGEIVARIEAMTPFIEFLNRPLLARQSKLKRDETFLR